MKNRIALFIFSLLAFSTSIRHAHAIDPVPQMPGEDERFMKAIERAENNARIWESFVQAYGGTVPMTDEECRQIYGDFCDYNNDQEGSEAEEGAEEESAQLNPDIEASSD